MCLPDGTYVADLSLAEIGGTDAEARASEQVVAEFSACAFLMHQGEVSFEFTLSSGECDYCKGDHELQVQWNNVPESSRGRSFWAILDLDAGIFDLDVIRC